jgi:hypothetical protein
MSHAEEQKLAEQDAGTYLQQAESCARAYHESAALVAAPTADRLWHLYDLSWDVVNLASYAWLAKSPGADWGTVHGAWLRIATHHATQAAALAARRNGG